MDLSIERVLTALPKAFMPEKAEGINTAVLFNILGEQKGQWTVTIKNKQCHVTKGTIDNPKLILSANSQDLLDILSGKMDAMKAFMFGKLKLNGDLATAVKLTSLFRVDENLFK